MTMAELVRLRDFLEENIDPDFGLLCKLQGSGTLTARETRHVKEERPSDKRNAKILDYILEKNKAEELIRALGDAGQSHVANYVIAGGEYGEEYGDDWPLSEEQLCVLNTNEDSFQDLIDPTDLLNPLLAKAVINRRQLDKISSMQTSHEKIDLLLEILRRRSRKDLTNTIECLRNTNQGHVAELLEDGGAVVRIHANLDAPADEVDAVENEISSTIASILFERPMEAVNRILRLAGWKCLAARRGGSIVLYIYCQVFEELQELSDALKTDRLKIEVQRFFDSLMVKSQKATVASVVMTDEDQAKLDALLLSAEREKSLWKKWKKISSNTHLDALPLELIDIVLEKSYLEESRRRSGGSEPPLCRNSRDVIIRLSSVDKCWSNRIRRPQFKKKIWRQLTKFYTKQEESQICLRINRSHMQSSVQPTVDLIKTLKSADCITDVEAAALLRQKQTTKTAIYVRHPECPETNKMDLFETVKSIEKRNHSTFIRCLRQTQKSRIVRVLENGGVVVRAEIRLRNLATKHRVSNSEFVTTLKDLPDECRTPRSPPIDQVLRKLKSDDMVVLGSSADGGDVACSIWCQTERALERLQTSEEYLTKALSDLARIMTGSLDVVINIDQMQLDRQMVCFPSIVKLVASRCGSEWAIGVAKLRHRIHVLCRSSSTSRSANHVIYVFSAQDPCDLLEEIRIDEIKDPWDIGSSKKDDCLYVSDFDERCVWKIKDETEHHPNKRYDISKWLSTGEDFRPRTLSVSSDGQLLMVTWEGSSSTLRVYGSDSSLQRSILLSDVDEPRHVALTPNGHFAVLHSYWDEKDAIRGERIAEFMWVVTELSPDGRTICNRFTPRSDDQKLNRAQYLVVDSQGRVFVADTYNDRVVLLDSDLQWNRVLISGEDKGDGNCRKRRPWRLCYDEERRQLVVGAEVLGEGVDFYSLSRK